MTSQARVLRIIEDIASKINNEEGMEFLIFFTYVFSYSTVKWVLSFKASQLILGLLNF
jgi:hypothetical protein